ncbi:MAG: TRAP transporter small permease [Burkholderiales bacterium]|jgi:TRAP-type C4-dicarboxylate transport system permease small subunit|nr:TRAP transporter small permease [Burkholderiales bacterium]
MRTFERLFVQVNRWLLIGLLAAMVVVVFANVGMRYLLGTSVIWSEEVARHLMIWLTFVGSGLALRSGAQIGIDSLQDALPPRAARALRALLAAGMLLLFVALAWYGVDYALRTRFQISAALGISMFWVYSGMPIGCALLAAHLLLIVRGYVRGREFVADDGVDHDAAAAL